MAKTVITDKGKGEILRLAFANEDPRGAFNYMALGGINSAKTNGGSFVEITDTSYKRESTKMETVDEKSISVSATFDETNINSSNGEIIKEIALVNSSEPGGDIFFAYCEVPNVSKDDTMSLKYTIIIEIE